MPADAREHPEDGADQDEKVQRPVRTDQAGCDPKKVKQECRQAQEIQSYPLYASFAGICLLFCL